MNRDELIESIIKEVKRVLSDRGIPVEPAKSEIKPVASSQPVPAERSIPKPVSAGTDFSVGSRDLTGKQIITQKDLEEYQGTTIRVSRKAVITPLAYDYARDKGITIVKVDAITAPSPADSSDSDVVIVALAIASDFSGDKRVVTDLLNSKGFHVRDVSETAYEAAVKKVGSVVVSGGAHFGVCIENSGMEGPIYGNRNPNVRAVHCRTTIDARAARVDYGANVIVIDSASDPDAVISGFCGL